MPYGCYNNECLLVRMLKKIDFVMETTHWLMGLRTWSDNFRFSHSLKLCLARLNMIQVTRFYAHGHGLKGIRKGLEEVTSRDKIHVLVSYIWKSLKRMLSVVLHMFFFQSIEKNSSSKSVFKREDSYFLFVSFSPQLSIHHLCLC